MELIFESRDENSFTMVNESLTDAEVNNGVLLRCRGTFATMNVFNDNRHRYTKANYDAVLAPILPAIAKKAQFGALEHKKKTSMEHTDTCIRIDSIEFDAATNSYVGDISIMDTPDGKIVYSVARAGSPVYLSSRALGKVQPNGDVILNKFITYDVVCVPGFGGDHAAEFSVINESLSYCSIDGDINQLILENNDNNMTPEQIATMTADIVTLVTENLMAEKSPLRNLITESADDASGKVLETVSKYLSDELIPELQKTIDDSKVSDEQITEYVKTAVMPELAKYITIDQSSEYTTTVLIPAIEKMVKSESDSTQNATLELVDAFVLQKLLPEIKSLKRGETVIVNESKISVKAKSPEMKHLTSQAKILVQWYQGEITSDEAADQLTVTVKSQKHPHEKDQLEQVEKLRKMTTVDSPNSSNSMWNWFLDTDNDVFDSVDDVDDVTDVFNKVARTLNAGTNFVLEAHIEEEDDTIVITDKPDGSNDLADVTDPALHKPVTDPAVQVNECKVGEKVKVGGKEAKITSIDKENENLVTVKFDDDSEETVDKADIDFVNEALANALTFEPGSVIKIGEDEHIVLSYDNTSGEIATSTGARLMVDAEGVVSLVEIGQEHVLEAYQTGESITVNDEQFIISSIEKDGEDTMFLTSTGARIKQNVNGELSLIDSGLTKGSTTSPANPVNESVEDLISGLGNLITEAKTDKANVLSMNRYDNEPFVKNMPTQFTHIWESLSMENKTILANQASMRSITTVNEGYKFWSTRDFASIDQPEFVVEGLQAHIDTANDNKQTFREQVLNSIRMNQGTQFIKK